jgi:hypothetical protein
MSLHVEYDVYLYILISMIIIEPLLIQYSYRLE